MKCAALSMWISSADLGAAHFINLEDYYAGHSTYNEGYL
jgi:hypothetical protein